MSDSKSTEETFLPVVGYEGLYEVSNLGRVRTLRSDRLMKSAMSGNRSSYRTVALSKDRVRKSTGVHRLVAKAFIPNPNNYPQVNHIDGVPSNNHVDNLEWVTVQQNIKHAFVKLGVISGKTKLKPVDIVDIRKRHAAGERQTAIARDYGVAKNTIWRVVHNYIWLPEYLDKQIERQPIYNSRGLGNWR